MITGVGCFDSHVRLLSHCVERGMRRVLFFEDDALPTPACDAAHIRTVSEFVHECPD